MLQVNFRRLILSYFQCGVCLINLSTLDIQRKLKLVRSTLTTIKDSKAFRLFLEFKAARYKTFMHTNTHTAYTYFAAKINSRYDQRQGEIPWHEMTFCIGGSAPFFFVERIRFRVAPVFANRRCHKMRFFVWETNAYPNNTTCKIKQEGI